MTSTLPLTDQLTTLTSSLKSTNTLITRLSTLSFQPGSESLSSPSVRLELAQDIHESLKQLEEDLSLLQQEADDLLPGGTSSSANAATAAVGSTLRGGARRESVSEAQRERLRFAAQISRLGEELRASRARFRRAQLSAKKGAERARQEEREAVFASLRNPPPPQPPPPAAADASGSKDANGTQPSLFTPRRPAPTTNKTQEQLEVDATTTITTSLRRTHALLETELSRSRFAHETLTTSTAALADLGEKYTDLTTLLSSSRQLLGTLLRSQKTDSWYLETAFWILCATLTWLVFRRILLGPFVRLPLFVLNYFVWKPVVGLAYLSGVVRTGEQSVEARFTGKTRSPLIVQPSAAGSGAIPQFDPEMAENLRRSGGVPAGAGGVGAKAGKGGEGESMSERIARMAEEAERRGQGRQEEEQVGEGESRGEGGKEGEIRRGDGTVLRERGADELPNPKKKVLEESQGNDEQRKRDEL